MEWWVSGADCGVSKGWPRCEEEPGNASFVLPASADLFINKVVVVLSVRVPASVGVPTAKPRLAVCVAPRPCTYILRSRIATHESDVVTSDHHRHRHRRIARGERWGESKVCPDQQQDQHHQVARPVRKACAAAAAYPAGCIFQYVRGGGGRWSGG